jgi:hypothetical protein
MGDPSCFYLSALCHQILAICGSATGKFGHAGIEPRGPAQGKPTIATRGT